MINRKILKSPTKMLDMLSIKTKLLLTYFILILLPLSIFTFISYKRVSHVIMDQTLASASQVFNEADQILHNNFANMEDIINMVTHDPLIYDVGSKKMEKYDVNMQLVDSNRMSDMLKYLEKSSKVDSIRVYFSKDFIFAAENVNMFNIKDVKKSMWYKQLIMNDSNTVWLSPLSFNDPYSIDKDIFSVARIIYDVDELNEQLAILRVDINTERIQNIITNAALTENSIVYIQDHDDIIFSTASNELSEAWYIENSQLETLATNTWNTIDIQGHKAVVNYKTYNENGWYLVSIIPQKDILFISTQLKNELLIFMLIITVIAYLLAYFISNSSVRRLSLLTQEIRKVQKGNLNVTLKKIGNDEIGELMENFNHMIANMITLVDEKYKMGQEIKNAELKALQAQINPHFLYNSLDLINCIAIQHDIPDIIFMVNALAKFYKLSLSSGRDVISVKDEITHVSLYVQIQNKRFDNRINLQLAIDEKLYEYSTLKILLQPIIENAIMHGIFEKESKSGTIIISGKLKDQKIIFEIMDDGIGMSEQKIQTVLSEPINSKRQSYGLKNINDRIKLFYGEKYGLSFSSVLGKGTTVLSYIPPIPYDN